MIAITHAGTRTAGLNRKLPLYAFALLLTVAVVTIYGQVAGFDFVNVDDPGYVIDNPHVRAGLSWDGIAWAVTSTEQGNWHPLTWLSLMLDSQAGGGGPRVFHLTNVALHILNTWLLLFLLHRLTGSLWRSGLVAALFAVHPLHVESVAWIAERKDVLSTLFWFLTMLAYVRYVERPGPGRYVMIAAAFSLGLMSKPMLVTLPLVLLLLDYWPLRRIGDSRGTFPLPDRPLADQVQRVRDHPLADKTTPMDRLPLRGRHPFLEKVPLLALSLASCVITVIAQQKSGAVQSIEQYPLGVRIANALVSYVRYSIKAVWPRNLSINYGYPHNGLPAVEVAACAIAVAGISILAILIRKRRPDFAVGWIWYMVTLVPVIGLVQVGRQPMADRYTYIPLVGVFVLLAWSLPELGTVLEAPAGSSHPAAAKSAAAPTSASTSKTRRSGTTGGLRRASEGGRPGSAVSGPLRKTAAPSGRLGDGTRVVVLAVAAGVVFPALMVCAYGQVGYWRDSVTLLKHSLEVTPDDAYAHNNLASALLARGASEEAVAHWREALRLSPDYPDALVNMAAALLDQGKTEEAANSCRKALSIKPDHPGAHTNLGMSLMRQGKVDEAIAHFEESIRLRPNHAMTRNDLGIALFQTARRNEAIAQIEEALRLAPDFAEAHVSLGIVLAAQSQRSEALSQLSEALRLDPNNATARSLLERLKAKSH